MESIEKAITTKAELRPETPAPSGVPLNELVKRPNAEIDESMAALLKLMLEQNGFLAHVRVAFISPEAEPDTGGYFHQVEIDKNTFVPTIFIVAKQPEHLERLLATRRSSNELAAKMLGINYEHLSPDLLRLFIISHELGHAADYVRNYESNPEFKGVDAADEWDEHYEVNLLSLPVSGLDPVDLRLLTTGFKDLPAFLKAHADITKNIDANKIKTLADLIHAQELAYRSSTYESYADNFAADFLKRNAQALNLPEFIAGQEPYKQAA